MRRGREKKKRKVSFGLFSLMIVLIKYDKENRDNYSSVQ
jgi:hypothetical protein